MDIAVYPKVVPQNRTALFWKKKGNMKRGGFLKKVDTHVLTDKAKRGKGQQ